MFIILIYDVAEKRTSKSLKICRKYLHHVQRSVFEGQLSPSKLNSLKGELEQVLNDDEDTVKIYEFKSLKYTRSETFGHQPKDILY